MAMASTCTTAAAATSARNWWGANPGITTNTHFTTTSISTQAGSPLCCVSSIPIRFPSPIDTGCRCGHGFRRRAPICNFTKRNSGEVGKLSARGRKESGEPRLKEATSSKGFSRSPLPSSGATAEVQDRLEDFSRSGPVEDGPLDEEEKPKVVKPSLVQGVQRKTADPDIDGDFEHREQEEVGRGPYGAQILSPLEVSAADVDNNEGAVGTSSLKEGAEQEYADVLKSESVSLYLDEKT